MASTEERPPSPRMTPLRSTSELNPAAVKFQKPRSLDFNGDEGPSFLKGKREDDDDSDDGGCQPEQKMKIFGGKSHGLPASLYTKFSSSHLTEVVEYDDLISIPSSADECDDLFSFSSSFDEAELGGSASGQPKGVCKPVAPKGDHDFADGGDRKQSKALINQTMKASRNALAHYNNAHQGEEYDLVDGIVSSAIMGHKDHMYVIHVIFIARPKDVNNGPLEKIFFAELTLGGEVLFCDILDVTPDVSSRIQILRPKGFEWAAAYDTYFGDLDSDSDYEDSEDSDSNYEDSEDSDSDDC